MENLLFEKYKTSEVTNTRRVIHTPSAFVRENFFHLQEAGCLRSLKPHQSTRRGLQSYLFLIVLSGSGSISYRNPLQSRRGSPAKPDNTAPRTSSAAARAVTTVSAGAGDCFFLDCMGEYTHISSADDPWELLWIHFSGPQAGAYYSCFLEQHDWHFRSAHLPELSSAVWNIIRSHEEPSDDTGLLTAQQIVNILTIICTETDAREAGSSPLFDKLKAVQQHLDAHYTEPISLDRLAGEFYISKYYLAREFKKAFGITIIQYLLTKKITNAKELLRYSNSSIEDIARLCGIDDPSYFNKVFKKMEGCTASEYRRRW